MKVLRCWLLVRYSDVKTRELQRRTSNYFYQQNRDEDDGGRITRMQFPLTLVPLILFVYFMNILVVVLQNEMKWEVSLHLQEPSSPWAPLVLLVHLVSFSSYFLVCLLHTHSLWVLHLVCSESSNICLKRITPGITSKCKHRFPWYRTTLSIFGCLLLFSRKKCRDADNEERRWVKLKGVLIVM